MKNRAFTLAEVLITLGIIGVVAAITMPVIIKKYQKYLIINNLKQSYSLISQAIKMSEAENGEIKYWDFPDDQTSASASIFLEKYIFPYLKITTDCGSKTGCWTDEEFEMNGNSATGIIKGTYINKFRLANGTNIAFYISNGKVAHIYIDVNGNTKPNTRGKDIFEFLLTDKIVDGKYFRPNYKSNWDLQTIKSNCSGTGHSCAKLIIDNGWEFPDDYPW